MHIMLPKVRKEAQATEDAAGAGLSARAIDVLSDDSPQ